MKIRYITSSVPCADSYQLSLRDDCMGSKWVYMSAMHPSTGKSYGVKVYQNPEGEVLVMGLPFMFRAAKKMVPLMLEGQFLPFQEEVNMSYTMGETYDYLR